MGSQPLEGLTPLKEIMMSDEERIALKAKIDEIKRSAEVTSITVSRVVKVPRNGGDTFVSLTAAFPNEEGSSLSLKSVNIAAHFLGMRAQRLAVEQAAAGGMITRHEMDDACANIRRNFGVLIADNN